jgi:exodeoxyribonuclease V gamma subunit
VIEEIAATVALIAGAVASYAGESERTSLDVALTLGGYRVGGTVTGVHGSTLVTASYSKLKAEHRISAWARLLALCVAEPGDWQAVVIGRAETDGAKCAVLTAPEQPQRLLTALLEARAAGLREPLPLASETSCAYAQRRLSTTVEEAYERASKAWAASDGGPLRASRDNDAAICCVYGPDAPFGVFWDQPAGEGERWFDEPNRFAQFAMRVWAPLIEHESIRFVR